MTTDVPSTDRHVEGYLPEPLGSVPASTLELLSRGELDVQITTARRFPRSLAHFKQNAQSMIRLDQATAESCFYALPRRERQPDGSMKRKTITGPSIRLAEIVTSAWGNIRSGARAVGETDRDVIVQGYAHDLQTNNAVVVEVSRRIVDRDGRRYSDDLVTLTKNAACAIARRNAVFAIVPRAFVNPLVDVAMKVAVGDGKTLVESRGRALARFAELGVSPAHVCEKLERAGVDDLDLEDLGLLHGLLTALTEGETTIAAEFPAAAPAGAKASATDTLTDTVRRRRGARPEPELPLHGAGTGPEPAAQPGPEPPKASDP